MAIDYNNHNSEMILECDNCHLEQDYQGDYGHCITEAKESGWKIIKPLGKSFSHYCSTDCLREKNESNNNP